MLTRAYSLRDEPMLTCPVSCPVSWGCWRFWNSHVTLSCHSLLSLSCVTRFWHPLLFCHSFVSLSYVTLFCHSLISLSFVTLLCHPLLTPLLQCYWGVLWLAERTSAGCAMITQGSLPTSPSPRAGRRPSHKKLHHVCTCALQIVAAQPCIFCLCLLPVSFACLHPCVRVTHARTRKKLTCCICVMVTSVGNMSRCRHMCRQYELTQDIQHATRVDARHMCRQYELTQDMQQAIWVDAIWVDARHECRQYELMQYELMQYELTQDTSVGNMSWGNMSWRKTRV